MNELIVFSSNEQLPLARAIQAEFYNNGISCKLWSNAFFKPSTYILDNFSNLSSEYNKAIIILGKDDCTKSRGKKYWAPRDNVILELGICIGALRLKNTFFVHPNDVKIPSDLSGINPISISDTEEMAVTASVVVGQLLNSIKNDTTSLTIKKMIMWDEYASLVNHLLMSLKQSVNFGGYYFEMILSVSRGGSILGSTLARTYGQNMPVFYLQEDRRDGNGAYDTPEVIDVNQGVINTIKSHKYQHILVVDSAVRTGITLQRAKEYLNKEFKGNVEIKTAVLLVDQKTGKKISVDYYAQKVDTTGMAFFYNQFG